MMKSVAQETSNLILEKAIIRTNSKGTITEFCINAEKLLGYSSEEMVGQNISKIFSGQNISQEYNKDKKNEKWSYSVPATTNFHHKILVNLEQSVIKDKEGTITGFSHSFQNIAGENTLEEKDFIMRAIVDSSDDPIISKTLAGIITSWNLSATRMFGYTESEAIGKHISIIIPSDRLEEEEFIISQIRSGNKINHFETIRVTRDGSERTIELSASPIKNKEGRIIGVSKIFRDVLFKEETDEKQATLAAIVDSSDDAIISKTINGIITSWNQAASRMFGYSETEVIGKHVSLIIPKHRMNEENHILENIRNGRKVDHFETIRIAKDGSERNISLTVSPIKNSKGIIIGASKTARDISEKVEAEKQRELYTKRLKELNQYKDEFMVMASHELKTPLTVILANLEILIILMEGHPNTKFVEKTYKQTKKLSKLISNLFEVSKIQSGKLELNFTSFDINDLIREIISGLHGMTKIHRIVYRDKPGINITADRYKIEQVLVNLIGNALKYTTEPGDIYVEIEKIKDTILFSVKDEGVGIPDKDLDRIFERFYRVSGSASSFSGSGIGLYISAEIIKAHNGKIWAESEIEKGSTFYFSIPLNQPVEDPEKQS